MPVFEWDLDLQASEWDWREAAGPLPEIYDVSEDFWRKFEELPDLGDDLESLLESAVCHNDHHSSVLRHHDCMWAGTCLSKEHKSFVSNPLQNATTQQQQQQQTLTTPQILPTVRQQIVNTPITTIQPSMTIAPAATTTTTTTVQVNKTSPEKPKREPRRKGVIVQKTVGRSLLINSRSRIPEPTRPDTPPSLSESEEDEKKTISVVPVSEVTNQVSLRKPLQQPQQLQTTNLNVQFDHNYDKVRIDDLGVQTPSDSEEEEEEDDEEEEEEEGEGEEEEEDDDEEEVGDIEEEQIVEDSDDDDEEIDVVSLNNTNGIIRIRNQPNTLPYNPSRELCRELQNTMASAITTNKLLAVNRSTNRRIQNGASRRKRKRDDTDDEDDDEKLLIIKQQQQQQVLINSRIMPNNSNINNSNNTNSSYTTSNRYHHQHHRKNWRRTTNTTKKTRFSTDSSETDCEKRSLHNNMERMRRIGLRNAFEDLRILIPSLKESKRAAKVNILKDSADYVRHLTSKERGLAQQVVSLRLEQEKLRSRLSKLRRSLAAHR
ncbi:hypothetical protein O3M35_011373 [Rhynocoris fuscipes]|uniref:BHLH domain-containing protein n=1 Tax=Rhynocoris fuscipes TaxID=488301 RepID=A0AAW1CUW1_9HEMI